MLLKAVCDPDSQPIPKAIDIVFESLPNFLRKTQLSREERELSHSHPQFPRITLGTPGTMAPICWRRWRTACICRLRLSYGSLSNKGKKTSPSFSSVRYPKLQMFVSMFRANVQNPVGICSRRPCCWSSVVHQHGGGKLCNHLKLALVIKATDYLYCTSKPTFT